MSAQSRIGVSWPALAGGAVVLVALGAGGAYLGLRAVAPENLAEAAAAPSATEATPRAAKEMVAGDARPLPDVVVTLNEEAAARAGIVVAAVAAGQAANGLRVPGVVMANAYRQVVVTPLVSGRVTRVLVELGQTVQRGQTIAQVFSPELAEAQNRYVAAQAELTAHEQELARTETLVGIGAASRQELERIHATHVARLADVDTAAARLQLLGLSASAIDALVPGSPPRATIDVPAPIAGVVTERTANAGLNVDAASPLLTVTDLSTVWVVVEIYEKDFRRVAVGSQASITTRAYPDRVMRGRVSYLDPQVSVETRTAKARVEVPNERRDLRLGMYAEASFAAGASSPHPMVPRTAVQNVGDRTVVYLVDPVRPGVFIEREVVLGAATGDLVPVMSGVQIGDVVVGEGSFAIRAERERLGLRAGTRPAPAMAGGPTAMPGTTEVQEVSVTVSATAFEPSRLTLRAGVPARLIFTRTSETTCATSVVIPSLELHRDLPLNQPVTIEFTPKPTGQVAFACGMNMLRGTIVVQ